MNAPWTDIGHLESEVRDLKSKINSLEHSFHGTLEAIDRLTHKIDNIMNDLSQSRSKDSDFENDIRLLRENLEIHVWEEHVKKQKED